MKEIARNKRAYFDYQTLEKIEAGIELKGFEVKAIKSGRVNLSGSYATLKGKGVSLINADIPPYQPANTPSDYDSTRTRRLLLSASQIKALTGKIKEAGLTLVPLRLYLKGPMIKVELGLARHKKKYDKRATIKKRETQRDIRRIVKRR